MPERSNAASLTFTFVLCLTSRGNNHPATGTAKSPISSMQMVTAVWRAAPASPGCPVAATCLSYYRGHNTAKHLPQSLPRCTAIHLQTAAQPPVTAAGPPQPLLPSSSRGLKSPDFKSFCATLFVPLTFSTLPSIRDLTVTNSDLEGRT